MDIDHEIKHIYLKTLDREETLRIIEWKLDNIINEGFEICINCNCDLTSDLTKIKCIKCYDILLKCLECSSYSSINKLSENICETCLKNIQINQSQQEILNSMITEFNLNIQCKDNIFIISTGQSTHNNKELSWCGVSLWERIPEIISNLGFKYIDSNTQKKYKSYLKMFRY